MHKLPIVLLNLIKEYEISFECLDNVSQVLKDERVSNRITKIYSHKRILFNTRIEYEEKKRNKWGYCSLVQFYLQEDKESYEDFIACIMGWCWRAI
jgi:hypothetical protein